MRVEVVVQRDVCVGGVPMYWWSWRYMGMCVLVAGLGAGGGSGERGGVRAGRAWLPVEE